MVSENTATVETKGLRDYELVLIVNPELSEEQLEAVIGNVGKQITNTGGVISATDKWGKRRLAYPIKRSIEGFYFVLKFKGKPAAEKELEGSVRISPDILRHLLVKIES